jgi:hypothetical protein
VLATLPSSHIPGVLATLPSSLVVSSGSWLP